MSKLGLWEIKYLSEVYKVRKVKADIWTQVCLVSLLCSFHYYKEPNGPKTFMNFWKYQGMTWKEPVK